MYSTKKRKRYSDHSARGANRYANRENGRFHDVQRRGSEQDLNLFIQAHEADLRRGPQAQQLAKSLEVVEYLDSPADSTSSVKRSVGSALIQWTGGSVPTNEPFDGDEEETISLGVQGPAGDQCITKDESGIWVDRYDVRLLLDTLPNVTSPSRLTPAHSIPGSPSGWSDLPSDTEETFFFSPEEVNDFRNEKRRRMLEQAYEERVKARLEEEKADVQEAADDDPWGGSDEEPDDAQKELMRRTATHLLSSPNPAQLEMRILANHGADKRFAFLRGRWSRNWRLIKAKLRVEKEKKEQEKAIEEKEKKGLGALAGYDSESGSEDGSVHQETMESQLDERKEATSGEGDEAKKEMRRQKAKEWAEKRRSADAGLGAGGGT